MLTNIFSLFILVLIILVLVLENHIPVWAVEKVSKRR
jgi:hypothetical protein